jgi:hypothetical protein
LIKPKLPGMNILENYKIFSKISFKHKKISIYYIFYSMT